LKFAGCCFLSFYFFSLSLFLLLLFDYFSFVFNFHSKTCFVSHSVKTFEGYKTIEQNHYLLCLVIWTMKRVYFVALLHFWFRNKNNLFIW
jgi:hypothetical protein